MRTELPGPPGYCSSQLIPYIGNKRALLPRLLPVFERLNQESPGKRFLDPFAGSGSVSRLARAMGMQVEANDWEPYSRAINMCWLGLSAHDLDRAFGSNSGLAEFLDDWNSMHPSAPSPSVPESACGQPYMARWFAPACTATPRIGGERLFYTAENATFLDRVRTRLEAEYPAPAAGSVEEARRTVILATLLLEAATHANTSGVFKAYHRGFGGNGKDALGRIMKRMELECPVVLASSPATVASEDAKVFLSRRPADIVYFDPPYNQHQYGSNYHILNTILRWDGIAMPMEGGGAGKWSIKAGIPEGWKTTRSPFCSKPLTRNAIHEVLDAADAATLVFSWNANSHLCGEELAEMLSIRGRLEIIAMDYSAYKGGRQSATRSAKSREYLFLVDTRAPSMGAGKAVREISDLAVIDDAIRATYDPARVSELFGIRVGESELFEDTGPQDGKKMPVDHDFAAGFFSPELRAAGKEAAGLLRGMEPAHRTVFLERVASCACVDIIEQLAALHGIVERELMRGKDQECRRLLREAVPLIRKLAHRKYTEEFGHFVYAFRQLGQKVGDKALPASLERIERLKAMRADKDNRSHLG